jgi:hypothetical protein
MLLGTNTNTRTIIKFVYKNTFSSDLVLFNDTKALETTCSLPSSSKKKKYPVTTITSIITMLKSF